MLKRLWQILVQLICALVLVVVVIYAYPQGRKYSYEAEKRSAVTLTNETLKVGKIKLPLFQTRIIVLYLTLGLVSGYVLMPFIQLF